MPNTYSVEYNGERTTFDSMEEAERHIREDLGRDTYSIEDRRDYGLAGGERVSGVGMGEGERLLNEARPLDSTGSRFMGFGYYDPAAREWVPPGRDMIDGGGAGRSGDTFQGGPFSGMLNAMGVRPAGYQERQEAAAAAAREQMRMSPEQVRQQSFVPPKSPVTVTQPNRILTAEDVAILGDGMVGETATAEDLQRLEDARAAEALLMGDQAAYDAAFTPPQASYLPQATTPLRFTPITAASIPETFTPIPETFTPITSPVVGGQPLRPTQGLDTGFAGRESGQDYTGISRGGDPRNKYGVVAPPPSSSQVVDLSGGTAPFVSKIGAYLDRTTPLRAPDPIREVPPTPDTKRYTTAEELMRSVVNLAPPPAAPGPLNFDPSAYGSIFASPPQPDSVAGLNLSMQELQPDVAYTAPLLSAGIGMTSAPAIPKAITLPGEGQFERTWLGERLGVEPLNIRPGSQRNVYDAMQDDTDSWYQRLFN